MKEVTTNIKIDLNQSIGQSEEVEMKCVSFLVKPSHSKRNYHEGIRKYEK